MNYRIVRACIMFFGAIRLVWLGVLYLFTALCWLELGHFPIPSLNDPKYIGYAPLHFISVLGMLVTLTAVPVWIILLLLTLKRKLLSKKRIVLMSVGSMIALIQLFADPFDLIYWLLD